MIRPRKDGVEGLLSLFWNVVRNLDYAIDNNLIPIIDFKNYRTQYAINNVDNVWDYYFTQPSDYSLSEVYSSQNVILSGLEIQSYKKTKYHANYEHAKLDELHKQIFQYIDYSDKTKQRVNQEIEKLKLNLEDTLGLYLRGTDYIKLKPSGHPIQPTIEQAVEVADQFREKYNIANIFLVTEDGEIYKSIKARYREECITPSFDKYIYDYKGKNFLSNDECINKLEENAYERGMNYLVKMIILSKCGYLIGGNTNGMWAVNVFAEKEFKDLYVFDLGLYGN